MAILDETEIVRNLERIPDWQQRENTLIRSFKFKDFPEAIQFVDRLAVEAEGAFHHPDIDIRWNQVHLSLTTHDEGGLTIKDFDLAATIDGLL